MSTPTRSLSVLAATALAAGLGVSASASALSMTDLAQGLSLLHISEPTRPRL